MTICQQNGQPTNLWGFIKTLVDSEPKSLAESGDDSPPWFEPGEICEVDEQTYFSFLEMLPPRWMHGRWFAFGEGTGPFRLFWKVKQAYFARELTDDETRTFCKLAGVSLYL